MDLKNATVNFATPVAEQADVRLDLNEHLIKKPAATYFVRVKGTSLTNQGIHENDLLIVDRSLPIINNALVIATLDDSFTLRRISTRHNKIYLKSLVGNNSHNHPLDSFQIWGTVTYIIHKSL